MNSTPLHLSKPFRGKKRRRRAGPSTGTSKKFLVEKKILQFHHISTAIMSMFGFGRPQPSSAEKIAAAEQEMDLVTDMFNK
jgi:import inner membrane translocase subunit TIM10